MHFNQCLLKYAQETHKKKTLEDLWDCCGTKTMKLSACHVSKHWQPASMSLGDI